MDDKEKERQHQEDQILAEDVKGLIKNVFSTVLEEEGEGTQQYDHLKAQGWIARMNEQCIDKLIKFRKPFKYVVNTMIMRRTGAAIHACSSAYYGQQDGCMTESYDISKNLYCVVSVYWVGI